MSDRIFASIWLLLCAGGCSLPGRFTASTPMNPLVSPVPAGDYRPDAAVLGLLLLRRPDAVTWPGKRVLQRLLTMVVVLVVYAWGFEWLGFPLATALLTAVIGLLFGATLPATAAAGVVMGAALWYAFDTLLDVTLPLGIWLS